MELNKSIRLFSSERDGLALRTITEADQESLRRWKNDNRSAFFFQDIIAPEAQSRWYKGYLEREHDWMFIVLVQGEPIGCMGFRLPGQEADIYNVILGNPHMGRRGWMRDALQLMCSYILVRYTREIGVKVLRSNPAIGWYTKLGFRERVLNDSYLDLKLDLTQFRSCTFEERA